MGDRKIGWKRVFRCYGLGECIELAVDGQMVLMRDSKNTHGPYLRFTRAELAAFIEGIRRGEFDELLD